MAPQVSKQTDLESETFCKADSIFSLSQQHKEKRREHCSGLKVIAEKQQLNVTCEPCLGSDFKKAKIRNLNIYWVLGRLWKNLQV